MKEGALYIELGVEGVSREGCVYMYGKRRVYVESWNGRKRWKARCTIAHATRVYITSCAGYVGKRRYVCLSW